MDVTILFVLQANYTLTIITHYRFLDVCVGWPGSVHDARVLYIQICAKNSTLTLGAQ